MMLRNALLLSLAFSIALLSACAIGPRTQEGLVNYDFGLPRTGREAAPRLQQDLVVAEVAAPAWMDNSGIYYRLAYRDAAQPRAYALSHWVMSPAALLGQRLRANIARASKSGVFTSADGVRAGYTLRLELDEFSQVFDAPQSSRAVLRLRASLIRQRSVVAQQAFEIEQPAATPNAEGGVRALIAASDAASEKLIDWLAAGMGK
jgi:cholesterol transport system auxiliary component